MNHNQIHFRAEFAIEVEKQGNTRNWWRILAEWWKLTNQVH